MPCSQARAHKVCLSPCRSHRLSPVLSRPPGPLRVSPHQHQPAMSHHQELEHYLSSSRYVFNKFILLTLSLEVQTPMRCTGWAPQTVRSNSTSDPGTPSVSMSPVSMLFNDSCIVQSGARSSGQGDLYTLMSTINEKTEKTLQLLRGVHDIMAKLVSKREQHVLWPRMKCKTRVS